MYYLFACFIIKVLNMYTEWDTEVAAWLQRTFKETLNTKKYYI